MGKLWTKTKPLPSQKGTFDSVIKMRFERRELQDLEEGAIESEDGGSSYKLPNLNKFIVDGNSGSQVDIQVSCAFLYNIIKSTSILLL